MYRKRRIKKRNRGKGLLLGSDWPKIRKNLQPYLRKKKQRGGTWWAYKKLFGGGLWDNFKKSWNAVFF